VGEGVGVKGATENKKGKAKSRIRGKIYGRGNLRELLTELFPNAGKNHRVFRRENSADVGRGRHDRRKKKRQVGKKPS